MPKICYVKKRFGAAALDVIAKANQIIESYAEQGYELTLRQIYYQFVSRAFLANNMREYKNLGSVLNDARLAGLIDWDAIVDRTRNLQSTSHWTSPSEIIAACAKQYRIDKWATQSNRVECWVEKDALIGVVEKAALANDVAYFSCRGYTSQSELWSAAMRLKRYADDGQTPYVIHLGDHDPSGMDMSRDIADRLKLFAGFEIEVRRIALNYDQVEQYSPPPNPAKLTDSRAQGYISRFGDESWELDALEPQVINDLITENVLSLREPDPWEEAEMKEADHREKLMTVSTNWDKLAKKL